MEPQDTVDAVEAVIEAVATIIEAVATTAVVYRQLAWDPDEENWAGLLKSAGDVDANGDKRIHAICVFDDGWDYIDPGVSSTLASINPLLPLGINFFHGYQLGTNADNSAKRLRKEVLDVMYELSHKSDLDVREYVKGHRNLRVRYKIRSFGATPVHYALGRMDVLMQSRIVR